MIVAPGSDVPPPGAAPSVAVGVEQPQREAVIVRMEITPTAPERRP